MYNPIKDNTSNDSSSHLKLCLCNLWINSLTCFDKNGSPYILQEIGIGLIALCTFISIPYLFSKYFRWSFVAWYSKPVSNHTYSTLLSLSHLQTISSITSLSEPPDIEQTIFLYRGLFIFAHALIKLSPIVWFTGQFSNNSSRLWALDRLLFLSLPCKILYLQGVYTHINRYYLLFPFSKFLKCLIF